VCTARAHRPRHAAADARTARTARSASPARGPPCSADALLSRGDDMRSRRLCVRARVRAPETQECIWEYIKDSHSECPTCRNPGTNRRSLSRNNQLRNITGIAKRLANALGARGVACARARPPHHPRGECGSSGMRVVARIGQRESPIGAWRRAVRQHVVSMCEGAGGASAVCWRSGSGARSHAHGGQGLPAQRRNCLRVASTTPREPGVMVKNKQRNMWAAVISTRCPSAGKWDGAGANESRRGGCMRAVRCLWYSVFLQDGIWTSRVRKDV